MHLRECLRDYGPASGFSCFSFERYNGILGSINTNPREIERTMMKTFAVQDRLFILPHVTGQFVSMTQDQKELYAGLHSTSLLTRVIPEPVSLQLARLAYSSGGRGQRLTGCEPISGGMIGDKCVPLPGRLSENIHLRNILLATLERLYYVSSPPADDRRETKRPRIDPASQSPLDVMSVAIGDECYRSTRLQLFDTVIGADGSRWTRSSWVLVRCGTRICPAQAIEFVRIMVTLRHRNDTTTNAIHHLFHCRYTTPPPC